MQLSKRTPGLYSLNAQGGLIDIQVFKGYVNLVYKNIFLRRVKASFAVYNHQVDLVMVNTVQQAPRKGVTACFTRHLSHTCQIDQL